MSTKDWISKVSFAKPSCWSFVDFDDHFQRFERLKNRYTGRYNTNEEMNMAMNGKTR